MATEVLIWRWSQGLYSWTAKPDLGKHITFNAKWKSFLNRWEILNGTVTKGQSTENTCSKPTVKTLDKYSFKVNNKDSRTTSINIFLLLLLLTSNKYLRTEKIIRNYVFKQFTLVILDNQNATRRLWTSTKR